VDKSLRTLLSCSLWLWMVAAGLATFLVAGSALAAGNELGEPLQQQVQQLAVDAGQRALPGMRVEVEVGQLDPRLRLAPCQRVEPYLPAGAKPWGRTRVGLRCLQGPTPWNVYLPVTVKVFGRALVAGAALPAGSVLAAQDLREEEVDFAAGPGSAITDAAVAVGRALARPLAAGEALRATDLKARQYFAAGQTVQVVAVGDGYQVSSEGQALSPGLEGRLVRVRTDSGRVVSGVAVAENRVEIAL
jgi:flagella basal body P-ring formation protein FlgA